MRIALRTTLGSVSEVVVATPPPLVRVPNVELIQAGTWNLSTGETTFTVNDLASAVAALDCPAVRRPVIKLSHDGNHGQPNEALLGYIDAMGVSDNGLTLVGDYAGMPQWFAGTNADGGSVLASSLPDRSIEGEFDHVCGLGHTHPFVVHAVSLLGVNMPGVSSLSSLQEIASAYLGDGVAAASLPPETGSRVTVTASDQELHMPNPRSRQVSATVTASDITRAFYASELGQSWDHWIIQVELDPLGVIYEDDATGSYFWASVTLGSGEGTDAVEFGDPEERMLQFTPKQAAAAAAAGDKAPIRFRTREESGRGPKPAATSTAKNPAPPASGDTNNGEGRTVAEISDEELTALRKKLGVADDADVTTTLAAVNEALDEQAVESDESAGTQGGTSSVELPDGVSTIETAVLEELQTAARAGQRAETRLLDQDRDTAINAAIAAGKTTEPRRAHWVQAWAKDPEGTAKHLESLAPGLMVPMAAAGDGGGVGTPGNPTEGQSEVEQIERDLFGEVQDPARFDAKAGAA